MLPGQSYNSPPANSILQELHVEGSVGSLGTSNVDTSNRATILPAKEDREGKRSAVDEVSASTYVF